MTKRKLTKKKLDEIRERAEALIEKDPGPAESLSTQDFSTLVHELRIHQIELELQNEELRSSQTQLEEIGDKYRELYDSAPVGYVTMDTEGLIQEINLRGADLLGAPRRLLMKRPFLQFVLKEDLSRFLDHRKALLQSGSLQTCALRLLSKKGQPFDALLESIPKQDAEGNVVSIRTALMDISERKRMEDELRKSREELEVRVQERTAELESYTRELQKSNKALQEFASIASHDMQEPLRKVVSFGKLLKQSYADSLGIEGKDFLDRMVNATERMQALLTSLLHYSRITTRAEPFRSVDLAATVREVLSDLEVWIEKDGGEVRVCDLPTVEADPIQMRQLFQNLIGNALKFHKEGEKPHIEVRGTSLGNGITEIVVTDNGIGFDDKYLGKIFMPFQRLHGRNAYGGTGMGLAICKKIVDRHDGTITARSIPGRGSVFTFTLPSKQRILNKTRRG
jgi:chemotaxis family two-component system sensor kinase Cph1